VVLAPVCYEAFIPSRSPTSADKAGRVASSATSLAAGPSFAKFSLLAYNYNSAFASST
jgi:hypothetical protein